MAYEIDININGGDFENDVLTPSELDVGTKAQPKQEASKGMKALGAYIVGQTITPMISIVKTQLSQQIGLQTGRTELQERINFGMEVVESGISLVSTALGGVASASSLGISGVAGGIVSVGIASVIWGANKISNLYTAAQQDLRNTYQYVYIDQRVSFNRSRTRGGQ